MNLRYYLRGLGIGIIITAVIMGLNSRKDGTSAPAGEQVQPAAEAQEKDAGVLADLELEPEEDQVSAENLLMEQPRETDDSGMQDQETDDNEGPGQDPEDEDLQTSDSEGEPEDTESEEPEDPEEDQVSEPGEEESQAEEEENVQPESEAEQTADSPEGGGVVFEIFQGDNSYVVSVKLEEAGLIASASAFDRYLYDNGYDRRLRFGTYEIPADITPEEIAEILVGNRIQQ